MNKNIDCCYHFGLELFMTKKYFLFLLLSLFILTQCSLFGSDQQESPLISPSGKFIFKVKKHNRKGREHSKYWLPSIYLTENPDPDDGHKLLYKDLVGISGDQEIYWDWDQNDRLWIYAAKYGEISIVDERTPGKLNFRHRIWQGTQPCDAKKDLCPPKSIYPK